MKYGKKNHVNLDWMSYNIFLLGQSKIGKTSLIYNACQKTAGDDGYLFLEIGGERGADAIEGINYVNCPVWDQTYDELENSIGFADICDDIVENKTTDYKDLRVVVWDTYDQLINLAEDKSIALYNRAHSDKQTDSINAAWGGYGRGEKYAITLMQEKFDALKNVGVSVIIIGHVKTKDVIDVTSGESYQILTSDQQQNYFNAMKKNMHIIGLAYIDRELVKQKTGRKKVENGKQVDEIVNKISSESRKVKFRDDSYCTDCGGRFAQITPEINLDADEFVKAIEDAILAEQKKSGVDLADARKEQAKRDKAVAKRVSDEAEARKAETAVKDTVAQAMSLVPAEMKTNKNFMQSIVAFCSENGYANPKLIDDIDVANKLVEFVKDAVEKLTNNE